MHLADLAICIVFKLHLSSFHAMKETKQSFNCEFKQGKQNKQPLLHCKKKNDL